MEEKINSSRILKDLLVIMLGTFFLALGIELFFSPNRLVTGGVTGVAIVAEGMTRAAFGWSIPIWLTNLILNVPLFLIGSRYNGKYFMVKSLFATLFLSLSLYVAALIPPVKADFVLASIFGGVFSGIGLGLVFSRKATTGGTDLAASIVHHFFKHISLARLLFIIDSSIIVLGFFIFGAERAMYAVIAVYITSKVMDVILEGLYFSKAAFVISDKNEEISRKILNELSRGATRLLGKGAYSGADKYVLLCVVSQKEIVNLKTIVSEIDKNAFVIVADVREVLGEGFQPL